MLALVAFAAVAACSSDVDPPGSGGDGSGGGGGGGAPSSSAATMDGMCDGAPCCTPLAPPECCPLDCGPGGAGGVSSICGGEQGLTCASDAWCDYGNDLCGNGDNTGVCTTKPLDCSVDESDPTCACDGTVYQSECLANLAGYDVANSGGCPAPGGTFNCGKTFCTTGDQYCVRSVSDVGGTPDDYSCQALPAGCVMSTPPSCDCLLSEPCGDLCEVTAPGGLQLTCPGG